MKKKLTLLLFGLLIAVGWINVMAQEQPSVSPAQRFTLSVVDNQSVYDVANEENSYTNILQLSQSTSPFKLTADLLFEGDNYIYLHRVDNLGGDVECARINLNAQLVPSASGVIGAIDFYNDFDYNGNWVTQEDLADYPGWSTDGEHLAVQSNGYAFINPSDTGSGLTFTVPDNCYSGSITVTVSVGSDTGGGYFTYCLNGDWTIITSTVTAYSNFSWTINDVSAGDVIAFCGGINNNGYSLYYTPDFGSISLSFTPDANAPVHYDVTPTISKKDNNNNWGAEESLGETVNYVGQELIDLDGLDVIRDEFSVSTTNNDEYPDNYSYYASMVANIELPDPTMTSILLPNEDVDLGMNTSTTVTVLGLNIEDDVTITTTGGFTVSPSTLTASQMNNGQDATVSYTGSESHATGTLTVTAGQLTQTVNLNYGFYACVNFLNSTYTNVANAEYIGPNAWTFHNVSMYNGEGSGGNYLAYFQPGGSIVYTMPDSFSGSEVEVKILSGTSDSDSTGDLWVNGEQYTYTAQNTSHSWNVSVGAGGTITIEGPSDGLSLDIAMVEITGVR